jgi:hypothetical protein
VINFVSENTDDNSEGKYVENPDPTSETNDKLQVLSQVKNTWQMPAKMIGTK